MADNVTVRTGTSRIDFGEFVRAAMKEYGDDVREEAEDAAYAVTVEATRRLRKNSPRSKTPGHRGTYAKGWVHKAENSSVGINEVIYGKEATTYAIAHLLEFGHARRGGGRDVPPAEPKHHMQKQQEWAADAFEKELRERISKL